LPQNENLQTQCLQRVLAWLNGLKEQRTRWAARWTWKEFTMGLHSTQRAEAVHSEVAGFCHHPCCFRIFWKSLKTIRAIPAPVGETNLRQVGMTRANELDPVLRYIEGMVSSHAISLVNSQLMQSRFYKISPTNMNSEESIRWEVTRIHASEVTENEELDKFEMGLASVSFIKRSTSLNSCSCQYATCWGLPCKHMLRLYSVLQLQDITSTIDTQRRIVLFDTRSVLLEALLQAPKFTAKRSLCVQEMSPRDRCCLLCSDFRGLAEIASTTEHYTKRMRMAMEELRNTIL
jgi:hypothetical protein